MKYKIIYQENNKIKKVYLTEDEYLKKQLPSNIISIKKSLDFESLLKKKNSLSNKILKDILYELSMMLDANILLDNALDILIESRNESTVKNFLKKLKHTFVNYLDIDKNLKEFNLEPFIISSFKIVQSSGDPKKHIKSLYEILNEEQKIKTEIRKAFSYPLILIASFIFALIGMFKFVVPKFESMFLQNNFELSLATKSLFFVKNFYENYMMHFTIFTIILVFSAFLIYRRNKRFEFFIHKILFEKLFIVSKIYKYKVMYRFFYVINSLLITKHEFHESIKKSKTLVNNKYFLDRIARVDSSLKSGKSIYESFKEAQLFDKLILNVIKIAELSNCIEDTSYEIRTIYKKRFNENVQILAVLIEPIFFILIMLLIVWIIVAIFIPLWSIGDILRN